MPCLLPGTESIECLTVWTRKSSLASTTNEAGCQRSGSTKPILMPSHEDFSDDVKSFPFMRSPMISAKSLGVFAIPPWLSKARDVGKAPSPGMTPGVAFIPYKAARQAGGTIEPSHSLPTETGANPAATPMALPDEEPHGVLCNVRILVEEQVRVRRITNAVSKECCVRCYSTSDVRRLALAPFSRGAYS